MAAAHGYLPTLTSTSRVPPWTFLLTAVAAFMVALDNLVVVTALPAIGKSLDSGIEGLQWTVGAYTLTYAVFQLSGAALGDRFGRRRVFVVGLLLFTVASAIAAFAPNIHALVGARAGQGLGAALVSPLALTILAGATPRTRRAAVLGRWTAISGIAIAIGPVVGGAIVSGARWQWIFLINVPIGALLIPAAWLKLSESRGPHGKLDVPAALLASGGLLALVFGLINGNDHGWTSYPVLGALGRAVVLLTAFVTWESHTRFPMLPMVLFRARGFAASVSIYLMMAFGLFGSIFLLTQFLQLELHYSALATGLAILPAAAMPAVVAPLIGPLDRRIGGRATVVIALALQAAALGWLSVVSRSGVDYLGLLPALMLIGIAAGLFFGQVSRLILAFVPPGYEGMASGTGTTFRQLGTTLGVAVLGAVFAATGGYADVTDFSAGLDIALKVGAAVSAVAVAIALLVPPLADRVRPAARAGRAA